jgi:hypothetical protein
MKRLGLFTLITVLLLSSGQYASQARAGTGTPGTFRGEVVNPPQGERSLGLIYLMGRDGNVRRVIVTRAAVVYAETVPTGDRVKPARSALVPGAEVRVTALVDARSGEWTASRVEVVAQQAAEPEDDAAEDEPSADEAPPSEPTLASRTI